MEIMKKILSIGIIIIFILLQLTHSIVAYREIDDNFSPLPYSSRSESAGLAAAALPV